MEQVQNSNSGNVVGGGAITVEMKLSPIDMKGTIRRRRHLTYIYTSIPFLNKVKHTMRLLQEELYIKFMNVVYIVVY